MKKITLAALYLILVMGLVACGKEEIQESIASGASDLSQKVSEKYEDTKGQIESKAGELVDKAEEKLQEQIEEADQKYEEVYLTYVAKFEEQYQTVDRELKDEAANGKNVKELASDCKTKINDFAELYKEGMKSYATVFAKYPYTSDQFKEWSGKLNEVCLEYGKKLGASYMEGTVDYLKGLTKVDWKEFGVKEETP